MAASQLDDVDVKTVDSKNNEDQVQAIINENDPNTSEAQSPSIPANLANNDFDNESLVRKFIVEDDEPKCLLKNNNELYCYDRETAKNLMYLIGSRDRQKVLTWIRKLDEMKDGDDMLERVNYIKYLVYTLSGTLGLVEPFTSMPPQKVKPLKLLLPPSVYADLLKEDESEPCLKKQLYAHKMPNPNSQLLQDKKFYEQQLFPPEGIICYAAAFSVI